jgi:Iron/manganese superoxide dismutases, alpha-hairpin domain
MFTLPPLPYDNHALEPPMSAETLSLHHGKHHKSYIDKLNASLAVWIGVHRLVIRWLRRLGDLARQFAAGDFAGDRDRFRSAPF